MSTPARVAVTEPTEARPDSPGPPAVHSIDPPATGRAAGALRTAVTDNLLVAVFGPLIVLLLGYSLYTTNDRFNEINNRFNEIDNRFNDRFSEIDNRFNDRFNEINDRFAAQDARIDRRFAEMEARINDRFAAQDARIDRRFAEMEARIDAKFAAQDARIDARLAAQDAKIDDIRLKLTALIAILNMTDEVDAAVAGELTAPTTPAPVQEQPPP